MCDISPKCGSYVCCFQLTYAVILTFPVSSVLSLFRVAGFPMPEVTWYKDGIAIQNNPDYQTTFDQGVCTLTIEETFTEDSAKFICRAVNAAGTAETNATLSVKGWQMIFTDMVKNVISSP
jgi:hypothetical protein